MKKLAMVLAMVMLVGTLSACGGGGNATTNNANNTGNTPATGTVAPAENSEVKLLKTSMPTSWDETHGYTQAIMAMNKYLDEVSSGQLQLDIYPGGQLGDETAVFECLQLGTVDCAIFNSASLSNFTHSLEAFDLPYLWVDENGYADEKIAKCGG